MQETLTVPHGTKRLGSSFVYEDPCEWLETFGYNPFGFSDCWALYAADQNFAAAYHFEAAHYCAVSNLLNGYPILDEVVAGG